LFRRERRKWETFWQVEMNKDWELSLSPYSYRQLLNDCLRTPKSAPLRSEMLTWSNASAQPRSNNPDLITGRNERTL
jgi:hypothetical protein